jgi:hypothetical protein
MANTTTINSELLSTMVADAIYATYENSISRQLMTPFDVAAGQGKVVQVPIWASGAAEIITDESATAPGDTNTTSVSITLTEHTKGHRLTDMLRSSAAVDPITAVGEQSGLMVAASIDLQAFALFNSVTASVGTEDSAVTVDDIFNAVAVIRAKGYTGPLNAVLGIRQVLQLKKAIAGTSGINLTANAFGEQVARSGYIGTLAGVNIFESSLVKADLDTDTDTELNEVGAIFAPSAFGQAIRPSSMGIQAQYQVLARATDVVYTAQAGSAILQQNLAVKIVGSSTD